MKNKWKKKNRSHKQYSSDTNDEHIIMIISCICFFLFLPHRIIIFGLPSFWFALFVANKKKKFHSTQIQRSNERQMFEEYKFLYFIASHHTYDEGWCDRWDGSQARLMYMAQAMGEEAEHSAIQQRVRVEWLCAVNG